MLDSSSIRKIGGFVVDKDIGLIKVTGADANRFLQAQTTNDINALSSRDSIKSCLLDRKAKIVADFEIYKTNEDFYILVDIELLEATLQHLAKFKFADKVEFLNLTEESSFILLEGPHSKLVLKDTLDSIPNTKFLDNAVSEGQINKNNIVFFKHSIYGENGFVISSSKEQIESVKSKFISVAKNQGFKEISDKLIDLARIEAGILKYGIDYDSNSILPETPLNESCVSYDKGCFQGQEVLARVKSHGAPAKALVGLSIKADSKTKLEPGSSIIYNGEEIGWIKSNCFSKFLNKYIAIAQVKRDYREPGKSYILTISDNEFEAEVELLPFYKAPSTILRSQKLYDKALKIYTDSSNVEEAIKLLREATTLNPVYEDAYESLGVILSKHGRLDEAIDIMKHLSELNPDSIMAHTNLSVFYLDKGWKEKAEEEKAISTTIQMLKAAREAKAKEEKEKLKEKNLEEVKSRLSMFEQVLEIDDDDFLANYGKGSCLIELGNCKEAIPYLEKAIVLKPNHTVAYLELAKAFKETEELAKTIEILDKGKAVASKRGDLEPLKKMQQMQDELKSKVSS